MIYYMVVGAGSFGRGLSELAAMAEWAWRVNADRVRGDTIDVKVYKGEDIEFPPASEAEEFAFPLKRETVRKLHTVAEVLVWATDDPDYAEEELRHLSFT